MSRQMLGEYKCSSLVIAGITLSMLFAHVDAIFAEGWRLFGMSDVINGEIDDHEAAPVSLSVKGCDPFGIDSSKAGVATSCEEHICKTVTNANSVSVNRVNSFVESGRLPDMSNIIPNISAVVVALHVPISLVKGRDPFGDDTPKVSSTSSYEWHICQTVTNVDRVASFVRSVEQEIKGTTCLPAASGYQLSFFLLSQDGEFTAAIHWQKVSSIVLIETNAKYKVHDGVIQSVDSNDAVIGFGECPASWPSAEWREAVGVGPGKNKALEP